MYVDKETYPSMIKLLKFALLITPSTANVERGFSILMLLCTKQRNRLSPKNRSSHENNLIRAREN